MINTPDRHKTVELIKEARKQGARLGPACCTIGLTSRTYQRWHKGGVLCQDGRPEAEHPTPSNKLSPEETQAVLDVCHQSEHAALPPSQIVPRLADQGKYLASESTFYRILHEADEQHHRSRSRKPKASKPPQGYCAAVANQVWSWDITWLPSFVRGLFFYLYMIVDIYSRKIIGWEVRERENAEYAAILLEQTVLSEKCILNPPTLHADNGSPQRGSTMRIKMVDLGVGSSFNRPGVSNDNPYSESLFRTCKYRPDYPWTGFKNVEEARDWVEKFVHWYNNEHLHSALRYVTPSQKHEGKDRLILEERHKVYEAARRENEQRWSRRTRNWNPVDFSWLNPPKDVSLQEKLLIEK